MERVPCNDLVQTAWAEHGWVDNIRAVGSCHNEYLLALFQAVHLSQELVDYALADL